MSPLDPEARPRSILLRRTTLFEEVWREPRTVVAQRYGISDVALGAVCRRLHVPQPGRGHWAKVEAGKTPPTPSLPKLLPGMKESIEVERRTGPLLPKPVIDTAWPKIVVPEALRRPHHLVAEASRLLRGRAPQDGVARCWNARCLDIVVAPASLPRALRIMHALITALEARGAAVEVTRPLTDSERSHRDEHTPPDGATRVKVDGEWIEFGLVEKRAVVELTPVPPRGMQGSALDEWLRYQPRKGLRATGNLELRITTWTGVGARSVWSDAKRQRLEDCLDAFVAYLPITASIVKRRREEFESARRRYAEIEAERVAEAHRRDEEARSVRELEEMLRNWRFARDTRTFIAELMQALTEAGLNVAPESSLAEFLRRAEAIADKMDPVDAVRRASIPEHTGPGAMSSESVAVRQSSHDCPALACEKP